MEKSRFVYESGKEIYQLKFEYNEPEEALPVIEECAKSVRSRPDKSVVTLTIVSGGKFNMQVVDKLKELTRGNEAYVKKAAVVGIEGMYKIVMTAVSIFSKRDFKLFDTREEAIKYLIQD